MQYRGFVVALALTVYGVALAVSSEPLLMDEPFGAVDAQMKGILQDELLDVWSETKKRFYSSLTMSRRQSKRSRSDAKWSRFKGT